MIKMSLESSMFNSIKLTKGKTTLIQKKLMKISKNEEF